MNVHYHLLPYYEATTYMGKINAKEWIYVMRAIISRKYWSKKQKNSLNLHIRANFVAPLRRPTGTTLPRVLPRPKSPAPNATLHDDEITWILSPYYWSICGENPAFTVDFPRKGLEVLINYYSFLVKLLIKQCISQWNNMRCYSYGDEVMPHYQTTRLLPDSKTNDGQEKKITRVNEKAWCDQIYIQQC